MAMATWLNWLHLMDMEEIKAFMAITIAPEEIKALMAIIAPEEIFETKDFKEITLVTGTRAMAMALGTMAVAMLEEPTNTRMPDEEEVASPTILHFLYLLTEINSLSLT